MTDQTNLIVESVARAICEREGYAWEDVVDEKVLGQPTVFREMARAAILAHTQALMENVSEEMLKAGCDEWGAVLTDLERENIERELRAMLTTHMEQMKCKT